jgi:hypothetical protein
MTTTNFTGGVTAGGGSGGSRSTIASSTFSMRYTPFDATSATQVLIGILPAGSRVLDVVSMGGATGGTNPTVLVGTVADDDGFAANLDADAKSSAIAAGTTGVLVGTLLTAATPIYGKVGSSAATGGTNSGFVQYVIENI